MFDRTKIPSLPHVWIGYLIALIFLFAEFIEPSQNELGYFESTQYSESTNLFFLLSVALWAYWYFCVYRIHKILNFISNDSYEIKPGFAVGAHFIPFYNLYWIFHWPNVFVNYINKQNTILRMTKGLLGISILFGFIAIRIDGSIGFSILFSTIAYINSKLGNSLEWQFRNQTMKSSRDASYSSNHEKTKSTNRDSLDGEEFEFTTEAEKQKYYGRVLGLSGKVTTEDVKSAYLHLIARYHPDRVQYLGEEFQRIAEKKTKEINKAFQYFKQRYNL
ncbi:MAG: J domain-containing protein [Deferribacteres bacterium]|nr:J domain-containing protein [candidate division KSB1 bacterium]MCB9510273.1 J domain-containing protein [Deferribacteres bacterium]